MQLIKIVCIFSTTLEYTVTQPALLKLSITLQDGMSHVNSKFVSEDETAS